MASFAHLLQPLVLVYQAHLATTGVKGTQEELLEGHQVKPSTMTTFSLKWGEGRG